MKVLVRTFCCCPLATSEWPAGLRRLVPKLGITETFTTHSRHRAVDPAVLAGDSHGVRALGICIVCTFIPASWRGRAVALPRRVQRRYRETPSRPVLCGQSCVGIAQASGVIFFASCGAPSGPPLYRCRGLLEGWEACLEICLGWSRPLSCVEP